MPRITYDGLGTPGVWAVDPAEAYAGLGWLHGQHRPLQSLLLGAGGRGVLAAHLVPRARRWWPEAVLRQLRGGILVSGLGSYPSYTEARREAQQLANATKLSAGVEQVAYDGSWSVRFLPRKANRFGCDARCEAVEPE